jgi:hypothetical protein
MDLQFIATGSVKGANRETKYLPEGNFAALYIEVAGETDDGQTLGLADLGSIETYRNGEQLQIAPFEFYHKYADIKFGKPYKLSGSAAQQEKVSFIIPFYKGGYPNVMQLEDADEAWIKVAFSSVLDERFGDNPATYTVYGVKENAVAQTYELSLRGQDIDASGAGRKPEQLAGRNIVGVYLRDGSDIVEDVELIIDGRTVVDNIPFSAIQGVTNLSNRLEAAVTPYAEIDVANSGAQEETFNRSSKLTAQFTGSGTLTVNVFSVEWLSSARQERNVQRVRQNLQRKRATQGARR